MLKIVLCGLAIFAMASFATAADAPADTSKWVGFSNFNYTGKAIGATKEGEYLNPVVAGFYPDPSVCRVGEDYYLVNSSFNYFPGIPIWHSKDLVNWTQIGNVLDRPSQFSSMRGGAMQNGIYAPTIRYNKGVYYVICTLIGGANNFYVTATDPKGPWSEIIRLPQVAGMDPSLFFDDDGKCYVTNCDDPPGGSTYDGHRAISLQELDLTQQKLVGEKTTLVNGGTDIAKKPVWCEGPHQYKINGKYYLLCAQGGTSDNHSAVIFRSDSLKGPYLPWDKNPILTQMDLPVDRENPVTCSGHADMVQTQNGEWWSVFLACQPYTGGNYNTGRQTFMLPVTWENDWPVILPPKTPVPLSVKKPNLPAGSAPEATTGNIVINDNFDSDKLHSRWIGIRGPQSQWHSIDKAKKSLFLQPRNVALNGNGNPTYLGIRQQNNDYSCTVTLNAQPTTANSVAGLTAFMDDNHWYAINVKIENGKLMEVGVEQAVAAGRGGRRGGTAAQPQPAAPGLAVKALPENTTTITLKIEGAGPVTKCFYKVGNGEFIQIGNDLESSFLSTNVAQGFQGVTLGMFARN